MHNIKAIVDQLNLKEWDGNLSKNITDVIDFNDFKNNSLSSESNLSQSILFLDAESLSLTQENDINNSICKIGALLLPSKKLIQNLFANNVIQIKSIQDKVELFKKFNQKTKNVILFYNSALKEEWIKLLHLFNPYSSLDFSTKNDYSLNSNYPQSHVSINCELGKNVNIGYSSTICSGTKIENNVILKGYNYIGHNVSIQSNTVLERGVHLESNTKVGANVKIGPHTVVGHTSEAYIPTATGWNSIPQIGNVEIGDHVEIGASCIINRASISSTRIGAGTKIGGLVHIAHNVKIGSNCMIIAQTGIAGSSIIGNNVILAGQVGIADHVTIGDGVQIGPKSGIMSKSVIKPFSKILASTMPIMEGKTYLRISALIRRLPELLKQK